MIAVTVRTSQARALLALSLALGCAPASPDDEPIDELGSPVQAQQAQDHNLYTNYELPLPTYNVDTVVQIDDDGASEGFFWALHGALENGDGYYVGLQENTFGKQVIFSIWNGVDSVCSSAGYAVDFTGEGEGKSCRLDFTYREGQRYRLRVWQLDGDWWGAWIINEATGLEFFIGKIRARAGAGEIGRNVTTFTEYFGAPVACANLPYVSALWSGVSFENRSGLARRIGTSVGAGCGFVNDVVEVGEVSSRHIMGD